MDCYTAENLASSVSPPCDAASSLVWNAWYCLRSSRNCLVNSSTVTGSAGLPFSSRPVRNRVARSSDSWSFLSTSSRMCRRTSVAVKGYPTKHIPPTRVSATHATAAAGWDHLERGHLGFEGEVESVAEPFQILLALGNHP